MANFITNFVELKKRTCLYKILAYISLINSQNKHKNMPVPIEISQKIENALKQKNLSKGLQIADKIKISKTVRKTNY